MHFSISGFCLQKFVALVFYLGELVCVRVFKFLSSFDDLSGMVSLVFFIQTEMFILDNVLLWFSFRCGLFSH